MISTLKGGANHFSKHFMGNVYLTLAYVLHVVCTRSDCRLTSWGMHSV